MPNLYCFIIFFSPNKERVENDHAQSCTWPAQQRCSPTSDIKVATKPPHTIPPLEKKKIAIFSAPRVDRKSAFGGLQPSRLGTFLLPNGASSMPYIGAAELQTSRKSLPSPVVVSSVFHDHTLTSDVFVRGVCFVSCVHNNSNSNELISHSKLRIAHIVDLQTPFLCLDIFEAFHDKLLATGCALKERRNVVDSNSGPPRTLCLLGLPGWVLRSEKRSCASEHRNGLCH